MLKELMSIGLDSSEASFYLAALELGSATVAQISERASVSRTNGYDLTRRLARRRLLTVTEGSPEDGAGRARTLVTATDPVRLLSEHSEQLAVLTRLVPQLSALRDKHLVEPQVRYLEGMSGMRRALFETLEWPGPIRGILSMRDMLEAPGRRAMIDYIQGRRQRGLGLQVVRSESRDRAPGWPSSDIDLRTVRFAPREHTFSVSTLIGPDAVAVFSIPSEKFAMVVKSRAYAGVQVELFNVLWNVSTTA